MNIAGESDLNSGGHAATITVFQLSSDTKFSSTPIETFWKNPKTALGDELVSSEEVLLYPDNTQSVEIEVDQGTQFIGVAANLRNADQNSWREIYPIDELRNELLGGRLVTGSKVVRIVVGSDYMNVTLQ